MHIVYVLFDTPGMDVPMKFMMGPKIAAPLVFCTSRVFPALDHKTTLSLIKK